MQMCIYCFYILLTNKMSRIHSKFCDAVCTACVLSSPQVPDFTVVHRCDLGTLFSMLIVLVASPCMGGCSLMLQCLFTFVFLFLEGSVPCEMAKLWSGRKGV